MMEAASRAHGQGGANRWWHRIPVWLSLFGFGLGLYLFTVPADLRNNADTVDRFFVTQSLLHGHVNVGGCGLPAPADNVRLVPGRDGCYYAIYAPGQTILMTPLYIAGKLFSDVTAPSSGAASPAGMAHEALVTGLFARMLDPILGATVLALFYLLLMAVGYRKRSTILLSLALAVASTVWPDVQGGQEQIQSTLALLALVYFGLRATQEGSGSGRTRWLLATGVAAGFGIFTRYDFAVDLLALIAVCAWIAWQRRGHNSMRNRPFMSWSGPVFAGFLPFAAIDGIWNTLRFGAPWKLGQTVNDQFGTPLWHGIPNLLVSPGKGLIWYLPLLWLVPFGWARFRRRSPELTLVVVALFVGSLCFYGVVKYWHGDPAWGPRYLFPMVPLLLLPLGEVFERFDGFRLSAKGGVLAVVGLSLTIQLAAVSVDPWRFWYHLIEHRQTAGEKFTWNSNTYNYYWSSDPGLSPLIYQFAALIDVARIDEGNITGITEQTHEQVHKCANIPQSDTRAINECDLQGLSLRPLNTVSPIWLSDRYQFVDAGAFPLQLGWRVIIIAFLIALMGSGAGILHLHFWEKARVPEETN